MHLLAKPSPMIEPAADLATGKFGMQRRNGQISLLRALGSTSFKEIAKKPKLGGT
jgi:hypothetical protein